MSLPDASSHRMSKFLGRFDIFATLEYILDKLQSARCEDRISKQPALSEGLYTAQYPCCNFFTSQLGLEWGEFLTLYWNNYAHIPILHKHEFAFSIILHMMDYAIFFQHPSYAQKGHNPIKLYGPDYTNRFLSHTKLCLNLNTI